MIAPRGIQSTLRSFNWRLGSNNKHTIMYKKFSAKPRELRGYIIGCLQSRLQLSQEKSSRRTTRDRLATFSSSLVCRKGIDLPHCSLVCNGSKRRKLGNEPHARPQTLVRIMYIGTVSICNHIKDRLTQGRSQTANTETASSKTTEGRTKCCQRPNNADLCIQGNGLRCAGSGARCTAGKQQT